MRPCLDGRFGNPSGLYAIGRDAQAAVDGARQTVAECLGARPAEILFTSGGTESINTATLGIAYAMSRAGAGNHIITTAVEHHAGLHVAQQLEAHVHAPPPAPAAPQGRDLAAECRHLPGHMQPAVLLPGGRADGGPTTCPAHRTRAAQRRGL